MEDLQRLENDNHELAKTFIGLVLKGATDFYLFVLLFEINGWLSQCGSCKNRLRYPPFSFGGSSMIANVSTTILAFFQCQV